MNTYPQAPADPVLSVVPVDSVIPVESVNYLQYLDYPQTLVYPDLSLHHLSQSPRIPGNPDFPETGYFSMT